MLGAPSRLRCEYLANPLGIDVTRPRLSWWLDDPRPAEIQTGYCVLAASSAARLDADEGDLWDTGKVESQQTLNVEYRGRPLGSLQRVWWKVRSFDSDGLPSAWSDAAYFDMGLLEAQAWRARWVGTPLSGSLATPVQVPMLRHGFELVETVAAARLYISALGVYRVELNGRAVSEDQLAPGWTDYRQRVRYQTYDVTEHLLVGGNAIGVLLGDGWFCGNPGLGGRQQYGERPLLCAQLDVSLESGARIVISTDHQWKWQRSWLLYSDLTLGESVDARQLLPGWSQAGCDEAGWYPVLVADGPEVRPCASMSVPLRQLDELPPLEAPRCHRAPLQAPRWLYDFGRVVTGRARVRVDAPVGVQLRIRYASRLNTTGELDAPAGGTDWYTTASVPGGDCFEPTFGLHDFRYVELSGYLSDGSAPEVTAVPIGARLTKTATLDTDSPAFNALFDRIQSDLSRSAQDLPVAIVGDSARMGVTGAVRSQLSTRAFNFDTAAFNAKWLDDLADAQFDEGGFPPLAPLPPGAPELHCDAGVEWSAAFVTGAWVEYRHFGDRRVLERHYPALRAYLHALTTQWPDLVCRGSDNPLVDPGDPTPADLRATAAFFHTARIAARIAGVLGNLSDLERFEELAQGVRSAFRQRFVTRDGRLVGDTDAAYVLALHLGLLDRNERRSAFERITRRIEYGASNSVDLLATPYLLQVLTRGLRVDLAYEMLARVETIDSLDRVTLDSAGWNAAGGNQLAGIALGTIGEWLLTALGGLDLDDDLAESRNAFRCARIQPRPPLGLGMVGNVQGPPVRSANASLDTVNGRYECSWEITESTFDLRVLVPCNCSALIVMPDGAEHFVAAGRHELQMPLVDASDGIPILREVSQAS